MSLSFQFGSFGNETGCCWLKLACMLTLLAASVSFLCFFTCRFFYIFSFLFFSFCSNVLLDVGGCTNICQLLSLNIQVDTKRLAVHVCLSVWKPSLKCCITVEQVCGLELCADVHRYTDAEVIIKFSDLKITTKKVNVRLRL